MKPALDPVLVFQHSDMSEVEEAKLQLKVLAFELGERAADCHAHGMKAQAASTRVEQMAEILTDEGIITYRDRLLRDGALELMPRINSPGPAEFN